MNLIQELTIHFWEQGRLSLANVEELIRRGLIDVSFASARLVGYKRMAAELATKRHRREKIEEEVEAFPDPWPGRDCSGKGGGRVPRGRRLCPQEFARARARFTALVALGRSVADGARVTTPLEAARVIAQCGTGKLGAALPRLLAAPGGALCQLLAWLDLKELKRAWNPAWGPCPNRGNPNWKNRRNTRDWDEDSGPSPGSVRQVPASGHRLRGSEGTLILALFNARANVLPALERAILRSPGRLGAWVARPVGMRKWTWEAYAMACLMIASTGPPGRDWDLPDPSSRQDGGRYKLEDAAKIAMEISPGLAEELDALHCRLLCNDPVAVPPGWPAMRMLGG